MIRYRILLCLFFSLPGNSFLFGQTAPDKTENQPVLPRPISDSLYLFSDSVRNVSARQIRSYVLNPDYAYANDPEYWKKQTSGPTFSFFNKPAVRWTLWIAITILLLFGIYQLAKESNFRWFSRHSKRSDPNIKGELPLGEIDYEAEIQKCLEQSDYRNAVRFMYLRLIYTAQKKASLQIRDSSTNAEIIRAFEKYPQLAEFKYLAYAYEYIFYGGFLPDSDLFARLKTRFESLQKNLPV